jgi:Tol biopolymer transport system component
LLLLVAIVTGGASGCSDGTGPGSEGATIAFVSSTIPFVSNLDIYTVGVDGHGLRQLTSQAGNNYDPMWSADGSEIVFTSEGRSEVAHGIFVMRADGSDVRLLTAHPRAMSGGLSPDRTQVAYEDVSGDLFLSQIDGSATQNIADLGARLTCPGTLNPCDVYASEARWSPDGSIIAFILNTLGRASSHTGTLYLVHPNGTNLRKVIGGPGSVRYPQWSPDGQRITVSSDGGLGGTSGNVWVVHVASLSWTAVTPYSEELNGWTGTSYAWLQGSAWSPGSDRLVYATDTITQTVFAWAETALWLVSASGRTPQPIHIGLQYYATPVWRPEP